MKRIFTYALALAFFTACNSGGPQSSEHTEHATEEHSHDHDHDHEHGEMEASMARDVDSLAGTGRFGAEFSTEGAISAQEALAQFSGDTMEITMEASINACCQAKGCWMTLNMGEGNDEIRVQFKDYAFFVPKNSAGNKTIVKGILYNDTVSVETRKHFAQDEGLPQEEIDKITEPLITPGFLAEGVVITKTEE